METTVEKRLLLCQRCGHKWIPMIEDPIVCPKCKSYKWKEKKRNG